MCCISQSSAVTFVRCGEQTQIACVKFIQDSVYQKLLKSIDWLSYFKNIIGGSFLKHNVELYIHCTVKNVRMFIYMYISRVMVYNIYLTIIYAYAFG